MHRTRNLLILLSVLGLLFCYDACAQPTAAAAATHDAALVTTAPASPHPVHIIPSTAPAIDSTAHAPTSEPIQSWWQALLYDMIFKIVVPIFVPVLGTLLFLLLRKLGLKIELETLDRLGKSATDYSEHKAKVWFKENGKKSSGAQKEDWAWELVESIDSKINGRKKARKKLRAIILAKLGEAEQQKEGPAATATPSAIATEPAAAPADSAP